MFRTREEAERTLRRDEDAAARRPARTSFADGDGAIVRSMSEAAYLNAVQGGNDPKDAEFWSDMERRHPHLKVPYVPRRATVSVAGGRSSDDGSSGRLTRFGRVTFHKGYGADGRNGRKTDDEKER